MCRVLFLLCSLVSACIVHAEPTLTFTPLIESVSVTLSGQQAGSATEVKFRASGDEQWQAANMLYFEPKAASLSGIIVYLTAATDYEVEITVNGPDGVQTFSGNFTTQANKPPVDPEKVYALEDIYQGGTLDIEALGIAGTADGWAMIKGDINTPIIAGEDDQSAIWLGAQSYIYFEDIVIQKGGQLGFFAEEAHHIWVNGCDISQWGREPVAYRNGIAYDELERQINYDSAFFLRRSGVITVENCYVHDPVFGANHWGYGHPKGTNAFLAFANHPNEAYQGQIILRNNTFTGNQNVRFNDVVEGRFNLDDDGGFIRDSAIYNNHFAYANDDIIEIDGSQRNVAVYNNDFSQGYGGISAAPNKQGPSFVFNNTVHKMGDVRGQMWAAIKVGGLYSNPEGQVNLFNNVVHSVANGITASYVQGDDAFWVNAINNVIITQSADDAVGYGVLDNQRDPRSTFDNNFIFNLQTQSARNLADITTPFYDDSLLNLAFAEAILEQPAPKVLPVPDAFHIANIARYHDDALIVGKTVSVVGVPHFHEPVIAGAIDFSESDLSGYDNKNEDNIFEVWDHEIRLHGTTWLALDGAYTVNPNTVLDFTLFGNEEPKLAGIGLDDNDQLESNEVLTLYGAEPTGPVISDYQAGYHQRHFSLPLSDYFSDQTYSQLILALDSDTSVSSTSPMLSFSNVLMYDAINFNQYVVETYDATQDDTTNSLVEVSDNGLTLQLSGNSWKRITGDFTIDRTSVLIAHVKVSGNAEIAAIGLDTNAVHGPNSLLSFAGSQRYGQVIEHISAEDDWQRIAIPIGDYFPPGRYDYLTFVLDNDAFPTQGTLAFKHVALLSDS